MYFLEFILSAADISDEIISKTLLGLGEKLSIFKQESNPEARSSDFKIQISTDDPTIVFDICSQFGRIKAVRIDEKKI